MTVKKTPDPVILPAPTPISPASDPANAAPPGAAVKTADDYTLQEIADHFAATKALIVSVGAEWPGMVSLAGKERVGNLGKLIALLEPSIRALFNALTPVPGEDAAKAKTKAKLIPIFDAALGDKDQGNDPNVFEVDLLVRRLALIDVQTQIVAELDALRTHFADGLMNNGHMVVEPSLKALDLAKSLGDSNDDFHTLLAPVTNKLGDLTKAARLAQAEAKKAAAQPAKDQLKLDKANAVIAAAEEKAKLAAATLANDQANATKKK